MAKKSKAQLKRLQARAAARGETYEVPEEPEKPHDQPAKQPKDEDAAKRAIAVRLKAQLKKIEDSADLKSKERRSAKRKAEAIAADEAGCSAEELLEWLVEQSKEQTPKVNATWSSPAASHTKKDPYIVFVGQLSYDTTAESLQKHFLEGIEEKVHKNDLQIRLLTDPKTKKSRGMAFIQVSTPEIQFACLKLHQTFLDGRRINVERTTGGRKGSSARQAKLEQFRTQQNEYMSNVVETMLSEFRDRGEIREGELDEGVVGLCARHSAQLVQAALERYVESNGRDKDNPSAYLSFLLTKLSQEGVWDPDAKRTKRE